MSFTIRIRIWSCNNTGIIALERCSCKYRRIRNRVLNLIIYFAIRISSEVSKTDHLRLCNSLNHLLTNSFDVSALNIKHLSVFDSFLGLFSYFSESGFILLFPQLKLRIQASVLTQSEYLLISLRCYALLQCFLTKWLMSRSLLLFR